MGLLTSVLRLTRSRRASTHDMTSASGHDIAAADDISASSPAPERQHPLITPVALATLTVGLAGCGGSETGGTSSAGTPTTPGPASLATFPDESAARFLLQAQFSANDDEIEAVRTLGFPTWLKAQYDVPIATTGEQWLDSQGYGAVDASLKFFKLAWADNMMWNQLVTAPDAVRKRVALALSEFFVVSTTAFDGYWPSHIMACYWDMLNAHAFGNFRDLLEAVTLSPAMGRYLNTKGNRKEDASGRQPDENYAREVLQLFSIGLYKLNKDGTLALDKTSAPVPTYAQADISNLARVFTGYDYDTRATVWTPMTISGFVYQVPSRDFCSLPMVLNPLNHSALAATFLGVTIPAGTDGTTALKIALDTIFHHPNTGPFFVRQMIQRLVTSNPSPAYVGRVAAVFAGTATNPRGDLKAVWTAILNDPEARTLAASATGGKLREPMIRLIQACRTIGVKSSTGAWEIWDVSADTSGIGQSPLRAPSVFNFFRPDYVPPVAALAEAGLSAPEFQIVNETTIAEYLNFMMRFLKYGRNDVVPDYSGLMDLAGDSGKLLSWLNLHLCADQLSTGTLAIIQNALDANPATATSSDAKKIDTLQSAIFMVMATPEYLVQK